jgi:CBS domain containing-hemolysin-like protein
MSKFREAYELMRKQRAQMDLVDDAAGTLAGIVTPIDLAQRDAAEIPDDRGSTPETHAL